MTWKDYSHERLIKECSGYYVIKPKIAREIVPLICPVCECIFRSSEDEKSYKSFGCCESCETLWARPNQEKWKNGWRPEKEIVLLKAEQKKLDIHLEF
jgi:hypothetical protein